MSKKVNDYLDAVAKGKVLDVNTDVGLHQIYANAGSLYLNRKGMTFLYCLSEAGMSNLLKDIGESQEYSANSKECYAGMPVPKGYKLGSFGPVKAGSTFLNILGKVSVASSSGNLCNLQRYELIPIENKSEKAKDTKTNDLVITITTEEMFKNYMECLKDAILDEFGTDETKKSWMGHSDRIYFILAEDKEKIRQMFISGWTALLVGEKMGVLDPYPEPENKPTNTEIRILDKDGKLILVVINDEISF